MIKVIPLFILLLATAYAGNYGKLVLHAPHDLQAKLAKANDINFNLAYFGKVPYGQSLVGTVVLAGPDEDGCSQITPIQTDKLGHDPVFIIMTRTHNCDPVDQAINAQHAGAKLAIIVAESGESVEGAQLEDDGNSLGVNIPTIIIDNGDGGKIITELKSKTSGPKVKVSLKVEIPKEKTVNYRVWLTSSNRNTYRWLAEYYKFYKLLEKNAEVTPHYVHMTCAQCADKSCVSGNRYCSYEHVADNKGEDVVMEDLRQFCIYKELGQDAWWEYVKNFDCFDFTQPIDCFNKVARKAGIEVSKMSSCVEDSFETKGDTKSDNKILKVQQAAFLKSGLPTIPAVQINKFTYHGSLEPAENVFNAICASYYIAPEICHHYKLVPSGDGVGGHHWWIVIVTISVILIFFLVCMIMRYRTALKREMMGQMDSQVSTAVSQYYAMKAVEEKEKEKEKK